MMRRNLLSGSVSSASSLPANTVFKLGTNGLVGAQNNIFLDTPTNSRTANTITRYGNVTQGTFSPYTKEAGKWSNYFDGYRSWLTIPLTSALTTSVGLKISANFYNVGNKGDMRWSSGILTASRYGVVSNSSNDGYSKDIFSIYDTTNVLYVFGVNTGIVISKNMWYSISVEFTSTTTANLTVNDATSVLTGLAFSAYLNYIVVGSNLYFDAGGYDEYFLHGYVSNVVISNSSGIILETCKDNRFKDSSPYNHVLTPTGNVKVSPFSPYANSAGYDASVYGGSGYFDGSGDYLQLPASSNWVWNVAGFRLEASVYLTAYTSNAGRGIVVGSMNPSTDSNAWSFGFNLSGNVVMYYWNGSQVTHDSGIKGNLNSFNWIELEVITSTTFKIYVNGIASQIFTVSGTPITPADPLTVGANNNAYLNGYISNLRITKAGTEVLNLKFANAGIRDESGMNCIETVGDAKVSSDGQGVVFDGSVDYLWFNQPNLTSLGAGVFELSVDVLTNSSSQQFIWGWRNGGDTSPYLFINGSGKVTFAGDTTTFVVDTSAVSLGVLYTFKVTRQSDNYIRLYRNGNLVATSASPITTDFSYDNSKYIGAANGTSSYYFNGTIKNLTITKGA